MDDLKHETFADEDINRVVMDFLVVEGHMSAAQHFQRESQTKLLVDANSIGHRMSIRDSVQLGDIEGAIDKVNDLNPDILDNNPQLLFDLKLQQLVELIRQNKIEEGLAFAQSDLAQLCEEHPEFLPSLEQTMALFVFNDVKDSPFSKLLDYSQRQKVASELNSSILTSLSQKPEPRLYDLFRILLHTQKTLSKDITIPCIVDISSAKFNESS
eukprot:c18128_g1_i1.p1 GENE.c18128_g1_i1~~c18128_g1_i1.p1  ORF type:complete len:240 (-),score=60.93 c18128_g1_i1:2-640(-)